MTLNWLNINRFMRLLTLIGLFLLTSSTSIAGIYKWTDAEGNVHYGQQRPRDTSSEKMNVPKHAPANTSTYKRPGLDKKTADSKAKADTEESSQETKETPAEKKQRLADCEKIRQNLATMESRGRVRSADKDGNLRFLSDEEKQARMAKSKNTLSKHCK